MLQWYEQVCFLDVGVVLVLMAALALHVEQEAVAIAVAVPCRSSRIVKCALWLAKYLFSSRF